MAVSDALCHWGELIPFNITAPMVSKDIQLSWLTTHPSYGDIRKESLLPGVSYWVNMLCASEWDRCISKAYFIQMTVFISLTNIYLLHIVGLRL